MACQQQRLDTRNAEAWGLYHRVQNRFAYEVRVTPDLFRALVAGWPAEDVVEIVERCNVIHAVLQPPKAE